MPLTGEEIAALVAEARPLVEGARVEDIHQTDAHTVYLTFFSREWGKLCLLFSTRPGLARFHLVGERPAAPLEPPDFCSALRKHFRGGQVEQLRQVSGDRVVEISMSCRDEAGRARACSLVLEMTGRQGHLVAVGGDRTQLASLHERKVRGQPVRVGEPYRFPGARPQPAQLKGLGVSAARYLGEGDQGPGDLAAPFHFAIASFYQQAESHAVLEEKRGSLSVALAREIKHREGVLVRVVEDLARTSGAELLRQQGELLKASLHQVERGAICIELPNYYDPGMGSLRIELDPALAPRENVERYFRRYQKWRRAQSFLAERRDRLEAELRSLRELLARTAQATRLEELSSVEEECASRGVGKRRGASRGVRQKERPAAGGPRRFTSRGGFEILVGRNARQNDELTLHTARGNDLFFHVGGRPGAHVILRAVPGKPHPLDDLIDAAQLAVYYSLPERSRALGAVGAAADVDYAPVKHVRKPRGAKPGLVLLAHHKTLRVRVEAERLDRLRRTALGSEPPGPGGDQV
jgi:predicted ribosome quality control (RQC) complex YloA/Tae2 family protein